MLWSLSASALTMDAGFFDAPTLVDFETGFPSPGDPFAQQTVSDAVFSSTDGDDTLLITDFSGVNSELMEISGSLTVDFTGTAPQRVGFDYVAGTPIYLEVYDGAGGTGTLLNAGDTGGLTGIAFVGFESAVPITSVIIHNTGATFLIDNFRYEAGLSGGSAPTPEPDAAVLFGVGLLTAAFGIRRRKHALH